MKRVIYTFATGDRVYKTMAKGLALSLDLYDSKTPRLLMTDGNDPDLCELYHEVIPPSEKYPHWFSKLAALDMTDADAVMFIDGDCLAVRNVDELFDKLQGSHFAVQGEWVEETNWYGDFAGARAKEGVTKSPTFSGGWLYYERTEEAKRLIAKIMEYADRYDELGLKRNGGKVVDEVCISLAMAKTGIGVAFPNSADFSVSTWYKMGRVHLDVLKGECTFIEAKYKPILCKPYIYHSAMARWDLRYWIQLHRLFKLYRDYPSWPRPADSFTTKVHRRLVMWGTKVFQRLTGVDKR
jgi:hypothetical protein